MNGIAPGVVAVTGATGFIGRHACERFVRLGWEVRALARDPSSRGIPRGAARVWRCDLPGEIPAEALDGARLVIHCAYATRHKDLAEAARVNEEGTRRIIEAARRSGARVIFLSSLSAHDEAESYYGRSKRALERLCDPGSDVVLRPGLVLGPGEAGLFSRMCESVRRARVIPLFGGGRQPLQTIHVDDLCDAIAAAAARAGGGAFTVAEPEPIPMRRFLELVAACLGRRPLMVTLPIGPSLAAFRTLEALGIPFPVSSENLLGLRRMRAWDTRSDLAALGVSARPAPDSLDLIFGHRSGRNT